MDPELMGPTRFRFEGEKRVVVEPGENAERGGGPLPPIAGYGKSFPVVRVTPDVAFYTAVWRTHSSLHDREVLLVRRTRLELGR